MKPLRNCAYALCAIVMSVAITYLFAETNEEKNVAVPGASVEVKIDNFAFTPKALTVAVGTTVEWTNHDDSQHTVVSEDKTTFKSKVLDTNDGFSFTFTKPGSYPYFCSLHPMMTGKIIVQ